MQVRTLAATGVLVGVTSLGLSVASPAYAVCESYSGGCPSTPPGDGGGDTDIGGTDEEPATGTDSGSGSDGDAGTGTDTTTGGNTSGPGGGSSNRPSTLPFTGGELVLLTALGAGALAGGTALVVAGRRKSSPAT